MSNSYRVATGVFCGLALVLVLVVVMNFASGLESGFFPGIPHKIVNGIYTSICSQMCFDLIKNPDTKGYHPDFLKMPKVKQTCIDAKEYGKMGYCSLIA